MIAVQHDCNYYLFNFILLFYIYIFKKNCFIYLFPYSEIRVVHSSRRSYRTLHVSPFSTTLIPPQSLNKKSKRAALLPWRHWLLNTAENSALGDFGSALVPSSSRSECSPFCQPWYALLTGSKSHAKAMPALVSRVLSWILVFIS